MKQEIQHMPELVSIRPIEEKDTPQIIAWRNKDWVRQNFLYRELFTEEGHLQWLHTKVETGEVAQFILYLSPSGREIGSVYLRDIDQTLRQAEYGVFIGEKDALGKGYGTQAARLALDYGFEKLGLSRIYLRALADNARAIHSYEKAGFVYIEGADEEVLLPEGERRVIFMEKRREQ